MKKSEFIRKQLARLTVVDFTRSDQAKIHCPFHNDTNPSLDVVLQKQTKVRKGETIHIGVGTFNCWSCKEHGPWNKLAKKLNLDVWDEKKEEEYADAPDNQFSELARDLEGMANAGQEYVKPKTDGPWEGPWRGLSGGFLRSMGAESLWDKEYGEYRVYLPIRDAFGVLVGHVAARGENSQIPNKKKYLNSKGFDGKSYWFGLDTLKAPKVVVIVEGPFDMLRFRFEGIPAVANLGIALNKDITATVSEEKITQLLAIGCTKVVFAFDADDAGRSAVPGFTASFQKWGFETFDLNLTRYLKPGQETMDPGDCPGEVLEDLKAFVARLEAA